MTQIPYRANLGDADFPLVSEFQGRTIIQPSIDQHYLQSQQSAQAGPERDKGIPEAYYLHNVMPSAQGYKSVSYSQPIPALAGLTDLRRIFPIKDFDGNRGHIAITTGGRTYIATNAHPSWYDVTPAGQPANTEATVASVTGTSLICYDSFGIFQINIVARTLAPATIQWDSGLTNADVVGIAESNNYLLAHDGATLRWSSSLDVLDFRESQITGAGKGTPTSAIGSIIALARVGIGFAVYCQGNIVVATFSGNVQYPWIFKEAPNGSGIETVDHLSFSGDDNSNYAWTSAGLLKVTLAGCLPVFPEVTDFLGGRIFEDFDSTTEIFSIQYTTTPLLVRVAFLASRFLIVSYGVTGLTHALVYDTSLRRWGKVKVPHVQAFDLTFRINTASNLTYNDLGTTVYNDYRTSPYTNMVINTPDALAPDAKHSICFLGNNGLAQRMDLEYGSFNADAVLLLGKYQILRANLVTTQEFTLETIDNTNNDFTVAIWTTYDGKTVALKTVPYEVISSRIRTYYATVTGSNHSLLIKGAFHLTAIVIKFSQHGNM